MMVCRENHARSITYIYILCLNYPAAVSPSRYCHPIDLLSFPAVNLNHFKLLRVVGKGAFGKVRIVERKDTGLTFALKYIRKDEGMQELRPGIGDLRSSELC